MQQSVYLVLQTLDYVVESILLLIFQPVSGNDCLIDFYNTLDDTYHKLLMISVFSILNFDW